jgi:V/A-type H+/Na+-transporting ATPase subunit D
MKLKVNPTRQELLKIKKRLKTAKSGHGLLKEKLDGLMQEFLGNIKELKSARENLEQKMSKILFGFLSSNNRIGKEKTETLISHLPSLDVDLSFYSVMGVKIRKIEEKNKEEVVESKISEIAADYEMIKAKEEASFAFDDILKYANLTLKVRLLAEEIEKTRRRVNSLEHIYIPEMERIKKYISQKLEERERFDRTVILKLKDLMSTID